MDNKSLDNCEVIVRLLRDITSLTGVFTPRSLRLTIDKIKKRYDREGVSFITKTLPSLGKAFDRALAGEPFDAGRFRKRTNSKLPILLGELFERVLTREGVLLDAPCVSSIKSIRQICYLFYKYELAFSTDTANSCIEQFIATDKELESQSILNLPVHVVKNAKRFLKRVLCNFNPLNITPKHGPGAVSYKEKFSEKYAWSHIPARTYEVFPLCEYFFTNGAHVSDRWEYFLSIPELEPSARVCLVPKDSRGPRIISAEPKEFQWLQQGIMRSLVQHLETHPLTRNVTHFTDQSYNQKWALEGSTDGRFATIDLKEASDRISYRIVDLLFPEHVKSALFACRSLTTVTPHGDVIKLNKFAPMGSALCFPVLALTIWAILQGGGITDDACLVYGDDVIVPREISGYAIQLLEAFGLKVNRNKSCTSGFFRESCGMDAFLGVDVTPVRIRTVWSSTRATSAYTSWVCYSNSLASEGYLETASYIAELLVRVYRTIPVNTVDEFPHYPCFTFETASNNQKPERRFNSCLQKHEYKVFVSEPVKVHQSYDGWNMLLRFFTEASDPEPLVEAWAPTLKSRRNSRGKSFMDFPRPFAASAYTQRKMSKLKLRWR